MFFSPKNLISNLIDDFDIFVDFYYSLSVYEIGALVRYCNEHKSLSDDEKSILFIDVFPELAERISIITGNSGSTEMLKESDSDEK